MPTASWARWGAAVVAAILGVAAAWHFHQLGLTLAHYDARGHLIVARRITDSLTPGFRQIGALWLPLPHVLNAIPVMWAVNYQSGLSAVVLNIAAMTAGYFSLATLVERRTGSGAAAASAVAVAALNPSLLYLTSTPMTEPLLFALGWIALDACDRRLDAPEDFTPIAQPGIWLALAAMTRYEAWPITAALVTLTALSRPADRVRTFLRLAAWPAIAAAVFLLFGRLTLGKWMADAGFFTDDNPAYHSPLIALAQITRGYIALGGPWAAVLAGVGVIVAAHRAWRARALRPLLPLALAAAIALPLAAFLDGHPYRVRYMLPLVAAGAAFVGLSVSLVPKNFQWAAAGLVVALVTWSRPPLATDAANAPMIVEAQREHPSQVGRAPITAYLATHFDGRPILASMNSLGHYMQETSHIGLNLRDFIDEGNGDLWVAALEHPSRHAGWMLIEDVAEGGDYLSQLSKTDARFLAGFDEVASGGGARLLKRK